ncbi:cytochrome P450 [Mycena maculata]|uniref:Cytochrome P450 n=1 Tax=Mycena maculata TaxID=230809 RepID=A0AAD7JJL8_9AGAR|nr:cytochrome P450 [Mycena maculata]
MASLYWPLALVVVFLLTRRLFVVPASLRHLPRVPIFPLLKSYLSMEPEDARIRKLILPFANERQEGVVLVWVLGRWMVHILDQQIARQLCDDLALYPKEKPPNDSLLWHLIGNSNILVSNATQWKKQSRLINDAINLQMPVEQFVALTNNVKALLGQGTITVRWEEFAQRFAVDALGSTVFGHDFEALKQQSMFVREYNGVMSGIANPVYLIAPVLERLVPRTTLLNRIDTLIEQFVALLKAKQNSPGDDMMSYMLRDPDMSQKELRDNMILLFISGHDTSAGALSTLFYFLATHPEIQRRAREEIAAVVGKADFTAENLSANSLPFLNACIRESLRINTPISYVVPRMSSADAQLGKYTIPAGTSLTVDIYAIHHTEAVWKDPHVYRPERFDTEGLKNWVPFALGPRQCPARNFAMYEQRTLAAGLLRDYEWELPAGSKHCNSIQNAFSPFALTVPHKLHLTFHKL